MRGSKGATPGRIKEMLLSLPDGDDNTSADTRHTLDTLDLGPVVEAQCWGQRLVIASAQSPNQAGVHVIVEIVQDYGWSLLVGGKPSLRAVRWPRLLEPLGRIARTDSSHPGVHVGPGEGNPFSVVLLLVH